MCYRYTVLQKSPGLRSQSLKKYLIIVVLITLWTYTFDVISAKVRSIPFSASTFQKNPPFSQGSGGFGRGLAEKNYEDL